MRKRATFAAVLLLADCGYSASRDAHLAQIGVVDVSSAGLLACAGPAAKSTKINNAAHVDTYLYNPGNKNGFTVPLPLDLGGVYLGASGTCCTAYVCVVQDRGSELHYIVPE